MKKLAWQGTEGNFQPTHCKELKLSLATLEKPNPANIRCDSL
jgi:hypothetical protein